MERITAKEVKTMMEALHQVYAQPEEQVEVASEEVEQLDERISPAQQRAALQQRNADAAAIKGAEMQAGGGQAAVQQNLQQRYGGRTPSSRQLARHSSGASAVRSVAATGRESLFRGGGGDAAMAQGLTRQQVMAQGVKNFQTRQASTAPASTAPASTAPASTAPASTAPASTAPAAPQRQQELDAINADKKLTPMEKWAKANPRLAAAQKIRQSGGSRAEVNKALYNKGTPAAAAAAADGKSTAGKPAPAATAASTTGVGGKSTTTPIGKPAASAPVAKPLANVPSNAARAEGPLKTPGKPAATTGVGAKPLANVPSNAARAEGPLKTPGKPAATTGVGAKPIAPVNRQQELAAMKNSKLREDLQTEGILDAIKKVARKALEPADNSPEAQAARVNARRPQNAQQREVGRRTQEVLNQEEYDNFDLIKAYLIDEGATEQEALDTMFNMEDEQREEILEGIFDFLPKQKEVVPGIYGKNTVLAKKDGVEGVVNKKTGEFTKQKGGWDKMDAERYSQEYIKQRPRGMGDPTTNHANRRETPNRVK